MMTESIAILDGSESNVESTEHPLYRCELKPHRSLSGEHFRILMLILGVAVGFAALRFIAVGAWPVVLFLGADVLAVWVAFMVSYRAGRVREVVTLTKTDLRIERFGPNGKTRVDQVEPYWSTVRLEDVDGEANQLTVGFHGTRLVLGAFLRIEDRELVAEDLSNKLQLWRTGNLDPAA